VRALAAWEVPSLSSSAGNPIEAVFDHFFGQGYDEHERLMPGVVMDISPRIISVHSIHIHLG